MNYYYTRLPTGEYTFNYEDDGKIAALFTAPKVFALVGIDEGPEHKYLCMYKHGREEVVMAAARKTIPFLNSIGQVGKIITLSNGMLEDINHFINTSALPVSWLERFEVIDVEKF